MPNRYPPAFRRQVVDLLKAGRSVAGVAAALDVSARPVGKVVRHDRLGGLVHEYECAAARLGESNFRTPQAPRHPNRIIAPHRVEWP